MVRKKALVFPEITSGHAGDDFVMNSTILYGWKQLTKVSFRIEKADGGGSMYGGLMIDDLKYWVQC